MKGVASADRPFVFGTRLGLLFIFLILAILVKIAWSRRGNLGKGLNES